MESNPAIEALRAIARLHNRLNEINHTLTKAPRILALHHKKVEDQQKKLEEIGKELVEQKKIAATKQGQLDDGETKIKKREGQLMECKSNDEYKALQSDINASKMAMSVLSDEILEVLEKVESIETQQNNAVAELEKIQTEFERFNTDMEEKRPALEERLAELTVSLKEQEKNLPIEFRDLYNRMKRDTFLREGQYKVLAPLSNGYCGNCNTHQVKNKISETMQGLFCTCATCGLILFAPEDSDF